MLSFKVVGLSTAAAATLIGGGILVRQQAWLGPATTVVNEAVPEKEPPVAEALSVGGRLDNDGQEVSDTKPEPKRAKPSPSPTVINTPSRQAISRKILKKSHKRPPQKTPKVAATDAIVTDAAASAAQIPALGPGLTRLLYLKQLWIDGADAKIVEETAPDKTLPEDSPFSNEREAFRLMALCRLGAEDDTGKAALRFVMSFPKGMLTDRVRKVCLSEEP